MNKIDIVVGASDKASAILKSVADETKLLSDALSQTSQSAGTLELNMEGVTKAAGALAVAAGALAAGVFAADFISKASGEFVELEKAARKLDPALKDLAKSIELGTNIDEKNIFALMNQAKGGGFGTDQIDDATKAAVGLAEVMNVSLSDAMSKVKQATEGNFSAFESLIPGINNLSSVEERLAAVSKLASDGLTEKANAANSATAVFDRMTVEVNNLYETVGEAIEPFRQLAFTGIAVVAELLTQTLEPALKSLKDSFAGSADAMASSTKWLTETIVSGYAAIEFSLSNLGMLTEYVSAQVVLMAEQMRSHLVNFFSVVPEYASWFAENFLNIMRDIAVGASHIVENLGTNLGQAFAQIFEYILGGWQTQDFSDFMGELGATLSQDLTRGFEPVTSALPKVGERAISDLERSMVAKVAELGGSISDGLEETTRERLSQVMEAFEKNPINAKIGLDFKGGQMPELSGQVKMLQAVESRVMVRGNTEDPLLNLSKDQLHALNGILDAIREKPNNDIVFEGVN
jgi:hypothetical protein